MDAASDGSVPPLDSPVRNFNSDGSDGSGAKYGPSPVATDTRGSPRDDTSDLDVIIAGCVFPVDDYLQVAEGLCRHPSWMVYPKQLASCLVAATEIVHAGDSEAERKSVELQRLYREMTPSAFEKCVVFDDVVNWDRHIQLDILVACKALAELVSVKLSAALVSSPLRAEETSAKDGRETRTDAETDELHGERSASEDEETPAECDALALLAALTWTFDRASAFHANNRFEPVPRKHRNHDLFVDVDRGQHAAVSSAAPSDVRRAANDDGVIDITADNSDATARAGDADGFGYELDSRDGFGTTENAFGTRSRESLTREHEWLGYILDAFGSNGGFVSICDALRGSEKISLALLDAAGKAAAACAGELTRERLGEIAGAVEAALTRVARVARRDVDGAEEPPLPASPRGDEDPLKKNAPGETENAKKKKKKNTVETFSRVSSFLRSARRVLTRAFGGGEAERRVSEAHRAVVEGLLGVRTFNAQLAALREINLMLESARGDASGLSAAESAAAAAAATSWISRARVVSRALRPTYLHHKQYVDQLCVLLRHLSQERALDDAHVDALWDVAFRPDAFEETRKNVAALLADVAKDFSAEQLDGLFRRVERVFGAARAGTSFEKNASEKISSPASANDELLEMVQRLAKGDLAGAMAERTLLLLWRAAADGSADGSNAAFARVLEHYDRAGVESASVELWTRRALEAVAAATEPADLAAAARLFRAVVSVDARADARKEKNTSSDARRSLIGLASAEKPKKKGLKKRRAEMEREARERAARRRARIRKLADSCDVVETLVSAVERCAKKSDDRALATVVDTTMFVLKDGLVEVGPATGRRLWAALAEAPAAAAATPRAATAARDLGARWMTELLVSPPRVVTPGCCLELLADITRLSPSETTVSGWFLFRAFFLQAALDANRLAPAPERDGLREDSPGAVALASPFRAASPAREEVIDIDLDDGGEAVVAVEPRNVGLLEGDEGSFERGRASGRIVAEEPSREPFSLADVAADELRVAASCDVAAESVSSSFAGLEHLWRIALDAPRDDENAEATSDSTVATFAADLLIQMHVALAADPRDVAPSANLWAREARAREAFLKRTLEHLGEAARAIASASASASAPASRLAAEEATTEKNTGKEKAFAERRASRCLLLLGQFIEACERADPARRLSRARAGAELREAVPHGGSFRGHPVDLDVVVVAAGADAGEGAATVPVRAHLNATVRWVKRRVARAINGSDAKRKSADCDNVRLVVKGRDLGRSDDEPLAACLRRDDLAGGAVRVHALVHRTDARAAAGRSVDDEDEDEDEEGPGAEARRESRRRERSPRALLARRAETYDALFELSDGACAVVRARAQELLRLLPTRGDVRDELRALLGAPGARVGTPDAKLPDENERSFSFSFSAEEARSRRERLRAVLSSSPSRGAYALQALDGLLTPPDVSADALRNARESAETGDAHMDDDEADLARREEDAREAETAEEARAFRAAFARLGFARDALALLPRGTNAFDASLEDAEVDVASAHVAWRDPELRRATCASALSVLSVSLADADSIEPPLFGVGSAEPLAETGTEEELLARDETKTKSKSTEEDVASFASFAADAAPSLATLARAFSDETGCDESGESHTENDEILATTAVHLFFKCARARASFEREDVVAASLLKITCFPATLRDVLTRARASAVRRAFALNTLRATMWVPPPSNASVLCVSSAHDSPETPRKEKREKEQKRGEKIFRPPPGFADVALAALDDAEARPERCREYFQVLLALLRRRDEDDERCLDPDSGGNEEEREANAKLDVAAIALFKRETEALRVAPREMDKEEEPDPRLLSRLETLLTLLDRLDRRRAAPAARAEVDAAVTRLQRTLLYRCLFPEAAPLLRPAEATLIDAGVEFCGGAAEEEATKAEGEILDGAEDDPEDASFAARFGLRVADVRVTEAHLAPACATPATRRTAFALLARLAERRVASEDFAAAAARDKSSRAREDFASEAASLAAPCGEEILDTVAALHHSGAIDLDASRDFSSRSLDFSARPAHGYVGLKNAGATCYMNAVFQQMFAVPQLRDAILAAPVATRSKESDVSDSVFHQLRSTFAALALSRLDHFAPRGFWRAFKDYDGEPINVREHQDGLEFFGRLQDQVDNEYKKAVAAEKRTKSSRPDEGLDPVPVKGAVEAAMGGVFVNQVISKSCPHRSERVEDFVHVSVEVRGKKNLEESLFSYVSGELLEADNQWLCELCGAKRDAVKRSCFRGDALPETLCVHLKRFEFDYETMQRHKIKSRFEFPDVLDMAPFTVEALEKLDAGFAAGTNAARGFDEESSASSKKIEYRLAGVVVHSGTAFAGHYYSYIRERSVPPGIAVDLDLEPDVGKRWHVFDDQRVEPYDVGNLEADAFGGTYQVDASTLRAVENVEDDDEQALKGRKRFDRPNSAYMLFYERVEQESSTSKQSKTSKTTVTTPAKTRLSPAIPAMPASVRRAVMARNLRFAFESNARDREYFAFVDALVRALVAGGQKRNDLPLLAGAATSGDRRRRRSNGAGESRAKKAPRVREADTPGGDDARVSKTQTPGLAARSPATPVRSHNGDDETETKASDKNASSPSASARVHRMVSSTRVDAFRAELAARFAVEFLCRTFLQTHARTASDAESLRRWRDAVTALVRASAPARLWALRWARAHPGAVEAFLGAPGPTAEARDAIAAILAAAVRGDDDADAEGDSIVADETRVSDDDDFETNQKRSIISRAADFVVRDVARAAGAAHDAEGDGADAPVSAWYFRVLAAYARAETVLGDVKAPAAAKDCDGFSEFFGEEFCGTYARIERLSRLELLEPLVVCARALGTRAGRRRELGHPAKLPRRLGGFGADDADVRADGASPGGTHPISAFVNRTRHETVSAVWLLVSAMLRACDTTQARRVFARRCASRAAKALGLAAPGGFRVGDGFRCFDLESDAHSNHETLVPGALLVFTDEDEDEETLRKIELEAVSPYGLVRRSGSSERNNAAEVSRKSRVPLTLGAFQKLFDFDFLHALAKTAAEPGWHAAGVAARVALCHLCWRWETVSYAVCLCVLERLDKAEHPEDVAGALRVCEALMRVDDSLAPTRSGFLVEGRTFVHPHAPQTERRDAAHGLVAPYLTLAISTATDRRPEDFPSGVIEQAAFEVCAAPKRLLVARFLVRLAEEETDAGKRTSLSLTEQHEDFGYVVGALGDEISAEDAEPVDVPREAEEEPPGAFSFSGFGTKGSQSIPAPYDGTLDDPATVLARAEEALGRAQAEHEAEPA